MTCTLISVRIRRAILLCLTWGSLAIAVATAWLWWRSFRAWDTLIVPGVAEGLGIRSSNGRFVINLRLTDRIDHRPQAGLNSTAPETITWFPLPGGRTTTDVAEEDDPLYRGARFWLRRPLSRVDFMWQRAHAPAPEFWRYYDGKDGQPYVSAPAGPQPTIGDEYLRVRFPHWLLIAVSAALPVACGGRAALAFVRKRKRRTRGLCLACGYDLRASDGRCPECGLAVKR